MHEHRITLPELALIGGTRAALGAGLGLLLANRLNRDQRMAAGWALVAVGALTTIPLAIGLLGGGHRRRQRRLPGEHEVPSRPHRESGATAMHMG